jgi:hypothetical protein
MQDEEVRIDVTTPDGTPMTAEAATEPVGSALRIAPAFVATTSNDDTGIETTLEAHYSADEGRYIVTTIVSRATRPDFDQRALRHTAAQAIVQAAVPHCIALRLTDAEDDTWTTVADLTTGEGRIIPQWMAAAVTKRGMKDERMDVIEILYGAAALADLPPTKAVQVELDVPHRTASDWIAKARAAGRLKGMNYTQGRPRQSDDDMRRVS